jgi:hypothetical protein
MFVTPLHPFGRNTLPVGARVVERRGEGLYGRPPSLKNGKPSSRPYGRIVLWISGRGVIGASLQL